MYSISKDLIISVIDKGFTGYGVRGSLHVCIAGFIRMKMTGQVRLAGVVTHKSCDLHDLPRLVADTVKLIGEPMKLIRAPKYLTQTP